MTVGGSDVAMRDAVERVVGIVEFALDFHPKGVAYARGLRSPYPHARIRSVEAEEARAAPGVVGVLTGADLLAHPDMDPYFGVARRDQPVLAIDKVRYVGDPVAMVVAESEEAADEALALVDVDYEELPYVVDAMEAARPGAPTIHDAWPDNECGTWRLRHGDVERGWAESDRIYEHEFTTPPGSHVPMEPFVTVAEWSDSARLEVWTSAQAPHSVRKALAHMFGLELDQVAVRTFNLGGGYGAKGQVKIEPMAACAALLTGRAVRLELRRDEVFFTVGKHASHIRIKTGVKEDGTLVARQVEVVWNAGAYAVTSPRAAGQGMARAPGPYRIPHVWVDSRAFYTNTVPTGPFRGAMTTQVCWAYESQLDEIAHDLGIDPVEIRRRNLLREGDEYATGERMHDVHFLELLDDVAREIEWDSPSAPAPPGRARGKGVAVMMKSTVTPSRSEARLRLGADGRLTIRSSSVEMGQGAHATLVQLASEYTGLPVEVIDFPFPDTDLAPFDTTTSSSRTTYSMGAALRAAASDLERRLKELFAQQLEVDPSDLEARDGAIQVVGDPASAKGYGRILKDASLEELTAEGVFQSEGGLDPETGQGKHTVHWHQGAAGVEVEVDLETGRVEVLRMHGNSWAGRIVSPHRVRQQNEGCAIWGLGLAFLEEIAYDGGQLVNPNLSDYMIPSILDVPLRLTTRSLETGDPEAELHGVGEMVVPVVPPAVGNALFRATGVRICDLPITPERVLRGLTTKGGST